jgi:hypothetical protein
MKIVVIAAGDAGLAGVKDTTVVLWGTRLDRLYRQFEVEPERRITPPRNGTDQRI